VGGDEGLVVYPVNLGLRALSSRANKRLSIRCGESPGDTNERIARPQPLQTELMYKGQRILQIVRGMDRKIQLLGFWELLRFFVRDLYANPAIVEFVEFQAFLVSVT
jgi:hypothetical protein